MEKIIEYLGKVWYDPEGQMIWGGSDDDLIHLADIRGWGGLTSGEFRGREDEAADFQDEVGKFIAQAIREKMERVSSEEQLKKTLENDLDYLSEITYVNEKYPTTNMWNKVIPYETAVGILKKHADYGK